MTAPNTRRSNARPSQLGAFDSCSDAELLADRVDPSASFTVFYRRHVDALIRFATGRRLSADTAADVVADTFLAALRGRHGYRPERDDARLWLLVIASRRIADLHRRRALDSRRQQRLRDEAIVLSAADRDAYERLLAVEDGDGLAALADLPELRQRVLRARILEDREYADIAAMLGLSEPAARKHVSRGLATLRNMFKEQR